MAAPVPAATTVPPPGATVVTATTTTTLIAAPGPGKAPASVTGKWWFWASLGGLLTATIVIIAVARNGHAAPKSDLGNMDAFRPRAF